MKLTIPCKGEGISRPGDLYNGFYFPSVLPGRGRAYELDVSQLLMEWIEQILINRENNGEACFDIFLECFKDKTFSWIHAEAEAENSADCWQILCGKICGILAKHFGTLQLYMTHQSSNEDTFNYGLLKCVGCLYLLFCLYFTQYPEGLAAPPKAIPISPETLGYCVDVCEMCESVGIFGDVRIILHQLLSSGAMLLSAFDGPQYYPHSRYGTPLAVVKDYIHFVKSAINSRKKWIASVEESFLPLNKEKLEETAQSCAVSLRRLVSSHDAVLRDVFERCEVDISTQAILRLLQNCAQHISRPTAFATVEGALQDNLARVPRDISGTKIKPNWNQAWESLQVYNPDEHENPSIESRRTSPESTVGKSRGRSTSLGTSHGALREDLELDILSLLEDTIE